MSFTGFPVAALDFYDDLEMDNTKSFWESHKHVYKECVEAPMKALLRKLERDGFEVGGEQLKTSPRGYDADHPRIHLLRHKQLFVGRSYGFEADAIGAGLVDRVRADWKALRPLVSWLRAID